MIFLPKNDEFYFLPFVCLFPNQLNKTSRKVYAALYESAG